MLQSGQGSPAYCTCVLGPSFAADRVVRSPAELQQQITKDHADPVAGANHGVALIMASTFHTERTRHKELPNGARMLQYCGIADLDAEPRHAGSKHALKENMKKAIGDGASVEQVCDTCPDFGNVAQSCVRRKKGFEPSSWFTGGKGVRVAWFEPACYLQYRKGDKDVSTRTGRGETSGRYLSHCRSGHYRRRTTQHVPFRVPFRRPRPWPFQNQRLLEALLVIAVRCASVGA